MPVVITHNKIATLPDEPGAEVNKLEWNENHLIVGLGTAAEAATTDFDAAGTATASVAAHESAPDPHPGYLTAAEGDAAYPPLAHNHTGAGQSLIPEAGLDVLNAPGDRKLLSYDGASGKLEWASSTEYAASSLSVVTGTILLGDVTSIQTQNDANYLEVQEVSGVPGHDTRITFNNVETFNRLRCLTFAVEGSSHLQEIRIFNVGTAVFDLFHTYGTQLGFTATALTIDNGSVYIDPANSNRVIVQIYHPLSGVTSHRMRLDWMVLVDDLTGGGGITNHLALTGTQDPNNHPATAISNAPAGNIAATDVQAAIDELDSEKVPATRNINTTAPLTGGGNLSADRTLGVTDFVASGASHARGAVPDPGAVAGTTKFLREDATWTTPSGSGYSTVQDEGTPLTQRANLNFIGAGVTAADNAGTGATDITISGGAGSGLTLTTVEVDLGTKSKRAGKFNITTTGLTSGRPVLIKQGNGPYTGKGTLTDEAEMDGLVVSGKTTSTTNIECFWKSATFVKGNFKFDYAVG